MSHAGRTEAPVPRWLLKVATTSFGMFLAFVPAFYVARGALQFGWDLAAAARYSAFFAATVGVGAVLGRVKGGGCPPEPSSEDSAGARWVLDFLRLLLFGLVIGLGAFGLLFWLNRWAGFWPAFALTSFPVVLVASLGCVGSHGRAAYTIRRVGTRRNGTEMEAWLPDLLDRATHGGAMFFAALLILGIFRPWPCSSRLDATPGRPIT